MQFKPFASGVEVNGQTVYAIVDGFGEYRQVASDFLLREQIGERGPDGLVVVDPAKWYAQAAWLRAFEQISIEVGDDVLGRIGRVIPRNAKFPPWVRDVESAIRSIDGAYHMNHRKDGVVLFDEATGAMGEGIGHYGCARDRTQRMLISVCNNPYPCVFDGGIISAMAERFEPQAKVTHDDRHPCRKKGADSCTFVVTW